MSGRISFIGAGPGAADLITMRGARRLAEADVVVWSASQVAPECIWEHARTDAEMVDSSRLRHEEAVELFRRAERDKLRVVRMHSGDPSLWGEVQEQHDACARMQLEVEVVPGVAAFSAAAASVGRELANPEVARSVVLARLDGGKAPMPDGATVRELARHGTTMAVSLAAARVAQLAEELREGGYAEDTPVLVAYKVSLPDEQVLRTTLAELETTVKQHKLWRNALFLVGRSVAGSRGRYGSGGGAGFRRGAGARRSSEPRESREQRPSWAPTGGSRAAERVPEQRLGARSSASSESDVAWWAVREWQDSARGGTRVASRSAAARQVEQRHQAELFAGDSGDEGAETGRMAEVVDLNVRAAQSRVDGAPAADSDSAASPADAASSVDAASPVDAAIAPAPAEAPSAAPETAGEPAPSAEPSAETSVVAEKPAARAKSSAAKTSSASGKSAKKGKSAARAGQAAADASPAVEPSGQPAADDGATGADSPASAGGTAATETSASAEVTGPTAGELPIPDAETPADGGKKASRSRSSKASARSAQKTSSTSKSNRAASGKRTSASGKQNQRAGESSGQESGPVPE